MPTVIELAGKEVNLVGNEVNSFGNEVKLVGKEVIFGGYTSYKCQGYICLQDL